MEKKSKIYQYRGPVTDGFGNVIETYWFTETFADSRAKARSNFMYQYKKECNLPLHSKICLPGETTVKKD